MPSRNLSFKVPQKCAHYDVEERNVYLWNPRALWRGLVGPQNLCCSKSEGGNQSHRKMFPLNSYGGKLPPLLVQRDLQLTDPSFGAWEGKCSNQLRCQVSNSCHLMRCWWWCAEMITEKSKGWLDTNFEVEMSKTLSIDLVFGYWMGDKLYDWLVGLDSKWIKFRWKVSSYLIGWEGWRGGRWSDVASSFSSIAPDNTALGHYLKNMGNIMQITWGAHLRGRPAAHWSFHAQVDRGGSLVSITCWSSIHQH